MSEKRLNKILQEAGIASRRKADELILSGKVCVDGICVKELGTKVNPSTSIITVNQKQIPSPESKITYVVNKPPGYVCSNKRLYSEKLIFDLFEKVPERLFTIGRLDKDAQGLILVTNDGDFAQSVIHPSANISKEYVVKVKEDISVSHLQKISEGVEIDGYHLIAHSVSKIRNGTLKIVLKDGKNHEVKHLLEKAELSLLELKRVRIGNLHLGKLLLGSYEILSPEQRNMIFE